LVWKYGKQTQLLKEGRSIQEKMLSLLNRSSRSGVALRLLTRFSSSGPTFTYQPLIELGPDTTTPYRKLTGDYVSTVTLDGKQFLKIEPEALRLLSAQAMVDIAHLLRPAHLQQLSNILKDEEATENDKFVALELLKNANIASNFVLPGCQDTGTAIVSGKRGHYVLTDGEDEAHLSKGIFDTYTGTNLRYSQVAPLSMYEEANTKTNLPAQIDLYANKGSEYHFQFIAKGGGSANKTFLYQQTKSLLNPKSMMQFLEDNIKTIGTSACPPYHLAIVIGGLSAELTLKTVKMASTKYYDTLPITGNAHGRAFRDVDMERDVLNMCQRMGIGAQFGGRHFCHDVRVIRLPRHGASCPVGIGVSCSADRQVKAKITADGVFLEQLETDVGKYLPEVTDDNLSAAEVIKVDLNRFALNRTLPHSISRRTRLVPLPHRH
jgi:fumarate hydratase class I